MTAGERRHLTPDFAIGSCLIALGSVLILDRLGIVSASRSLQFWPLGLVLLGVSFLVQAMGRRDSTSANEPSRVPVGMIFWLVVLSLFFARPFSARDEERTGTADLQLLAVMGGDRRVAAAETFHGAEMTSFMGGSVLDLRQAALPAGEEAVIDIRALMGGAVVRVPAAWQVDVRVRQVMGGVEDERRNRPASGADDRSANTTAMEGAPPRLVLTGFVVMGGVSIKN